MIVFSPLKWQVPLGQFVKDDVFKVCTTEIFGPFQVHTYTNTNTNSAYHYTLDALAYNRYLLLEDSYVLSNPTSIVYYSILLR